ncbi:glycoprotein-N-acetylgalactosamine 3-beta-galactosyltransferase 1 isoform X1 [Drosophila elegans]|uniref:glycoprotein-N-acetylgalactosamine 3-beta-galactosyltransferase 1 isoform X1 n=2 Tax=Drosophila elegans TaxID=30023 RepID=UPI001BC83F9D|nr:glycoprotein-N-acetylgalactosamine 3-beta-galactosyltransferase 1 isoform X1 [Drosophila elegans]
MTSPRRVVFFLFLALILFLFVTLFYNINGIERSPPKTSLKHGLDPLYEENRILCMIPYDYYNPNTAKYVKRTWGKHCNVLLFVSGDVDGELEPYVPVINSTDTWTLVQRGLMHAYRFYADQVDWFLRVEPSSFVVVENLRYMIGQRNYLPSQPIYFGYELENIVTHKPFVHHQSGYVISREALRRYTTASKDPENRECQHWQGYAEGLDIFRCLSHVNVTIVESRDELGHETFSPIPMDRQFLDGYNYIPWLHNLTYHKVPETTVPLSERAISFRVAYPPQMYGYYYFVYGMKIFGAPMQNTIEFRP